MKPQFCLPVLFSVMTTLSYAQNTITSNDEAAIQSILQNIETSWNARSGKGYSADFAEVHDYIVWSGLYLPNQSKEMNARVHQSIFDTMYKTTDNRIVLDKIKPVRSDLVMVHALGATYEHGTSIPENPKVIVTMLMEKQKDGWKIISFHNCDIEISFEPGAKDSPIPARVMFASWYKANGNG